jgi:hypothetical protein
MNKKIITYSLSLVFLIGMGFFVSSYLIKKQIGTKYLEQKENNPTLVLSNASSSEISSSTCDGLVRGGENSLIVSLMPTSGPIGTELEINGCNLAGFEGDKDVFFERSDGKKIMIEEGAGRWDTGISKMKIIIKEPCKEGEKVVGRYSGEETLCDYVAMTPGVYKVYVEPWGKRSNEVSFVITP